MSIWSINPLTLLFLHIQRSTNADLQAIQFLISNHPSKYIRNSHDSNSFVNKPNTDGIRPLYEAARNGHNETVQLLLENGANPHLKSNDENSLQVACRWNYLVIVKILVNSTTWSQKEIKEALKETKNKSIVEVLSVNLSKQGCFWNILCGN